MSKGPGPVTAALQEHDPKARTAKSFDGFAQIKDATTLFAVKELGILDKNRKETVIEALNLRNRCGHPGNYRSGVKKVSAFVEDITSFVFAQGDVGYQDHAAAGAARRR
jgi:hypothetical protein